MSLTKCYWCVGDFKGQKQIVTCRIPGNPMYGIRIVLCSKECLTAYIDWWKKKYGYEDKV